MQKEFKEDQDFAKRKEALGNKKNEEGLWTMYFDGSINKIGVSAGVFIISLIKDF